LPALEAAGYDRSIEHIRATTVSSPAAPQQAVELAGWNLVRIDRSRREVTLPPGMRIDLGGVAKGEFANVLARELAHWPGGCIDAGGDLRLWGLPPKGECWTIGIENPFCAGSDLLAIELSAPSAGVATSGTHRRRWQAGMQSAHHLIDPRSGAPAADSVRSVTAIAQDAATADVAAKALLIAGAQGETDDLFGASLAVLTYADGRTEIVSEEEGHGFSRSPIATFSLSS
jgi:thiamine biosynthesis lipoprotein